MKKVARKLSLSRETLRFLQEKSVDSAEGGSGYTVWSGCVCTAYTQCCTGQGCPTRLCW